MKKKMLPMMIAALVVVGGGSFYGGMKYDQTKTAAARGARAGQFAGGAGQFAGAPGAGGRAPGAAGARGMSGGFANGQILANDGKTMTLKLANGGSKIVFLADSTEISKFAAGAAADLAVGKNVTVVGKPNSDGSVTATSVQVRPDGLVPTGAPAPAGAAATAPKP